MSYWEDRYIEYLGEQDGQIGGDGWRDDFNPRVSLEKHLKGENKMPLAWKPKESEVYKDWVRIILNEAYDELSKWETTFVDSINEQLENGRILSEKQERVLERIYSEKTK